MYYNKEMIRVSFSALQRIRSKTSSTYRKQQKKLKLRIKLAVYGTIIVVSALCGLIAAHFYQAAATATANAPRTAKMAARQNADSDSSLSDHSTQDNPLFATSPSWSQNFTSQTSKLLDARYWNVLVGPAENSNNEQQYYTNNVANLRIENGALRLIASKQDQPGGYKYGSARIETQAKQTFLYGRIDIVAKLPSGVGTWPAVWLLPANDIYAKKSPESNLLRYKNGGEIDIIEAVGFEPDVMYGVAHTASDLSRRSDGTGQYSTVTVPGSSTSFNKYTLLWTPTSVTFAVNDKPYYTYARPQGADYATWPFDQPFYLIANLAMGGSWGGMDTAHYPGNGIDDSVLPASLDIRSIHYYPYVGAKDIK
ncbi:MAG: glycoside hydrolase family 16 [Candidatus Saccharibacteria bacterium]|nr:glycoside hydrolase family 16 [Candidatus Saccharibacteria bacterium]